ncbi:hypothetical protein BKA67DRAFT_657307 [Truncatella angustata]|uniref:Rhodopsin domain-containing protein n=1 Tax=Truncatella angustata TaxID=152316 RepID=A0A9P8ZZR7_9PEZI|nr:uncharacterized protein BKA67DRAFT_657307 [Truncatella angustata]KAH6655360.1 hypothetical protein BKA67DRAFT_657307 [Truncatella angustata]
MAVVENRGPQLLVVCITLLTIAIVSMVLRCFTRVFIVKGFGRDDYLMVFAAISMTLFCTCAITGVHYGTGRHHKDLTTPNIEEAMKYWWLCYIWYCVTMISSKLSIGVFLLRITVSKLHHYILYILMFLSVVTGLVFFFVTLFQCYPVTYFWYKEQDGTCIDSGIIAALTYLYSAISVIVDFTFALLPLHIIRGLQMHKRTKLALIPILGMGCIASIAVVVRFAFIEKFKDPDFLWATVDIAIWSTTEQGLAITAGSLASLQPLAKRMGQRLGIWQTQQTRSKGSKDMLPKTIGSLDQSKRHKKLGSRSANDTFGMTTFDNNDWNDRDEGRREGVDSYPMKNQIMLTRDVTVTTKRGSMWTVSEKKGNESEEELTQKSSKDAYIEELAVPRSFLFDDHQAKKA